jgi:nucleoside-diphosphate-sugar epimerase
VTGSTCVVGAGWLGAEIARALPPPVIATTRTGSWSDGAAPEGVAVVALDVMGEPIDAAAIAGCDRFAIAIAPGRAEIDRRAFYVEGARRLLAAVLAAHVRRVVWVSSTSALPDTDGWVDESCEAWPSEERGLVQREAEAIVASSCAAAGVPHLVLRMGGLYGPGRELDRIYRARDTVLPGDGMTATNLVHRDDAVASVLAALAAPAAIRGVVHVVDDDHRTRREMFDAIARARGVPAVRWERAAAPDAPARGKKVRADRLRRDLGVALRHPTHAA